MKKQILAIFFLVLNFFLVPSATPKEHNEASYQNAYCKLHNGIVEYQNPDFTRVDCLTDMYAIEFDFAQKWAESIGQALHYQEMTGKKAKIVLILESPTKEMVYFKRVEKLSEKYDFEVEYVTRDILKLEDDKCENPKCKCQKND